MLLLGVSAPSYAQGYFDFGDIPGADQPAVSIELNREMLQFVTRATGVTDPAAAEMLAGLEGIRVRVFEEVRNPRDVAEFVDDVSTTLSRDGWMPMVSVQEDESKVRIFAQLDEGVVTGMTIMVIDGEEAVFINIAGRINPEQLGQLAGAMGAGGMLDSFLTPGLVVPSPPPAPSAP
ncbi:MAG: DUF4252 domain-containing protein [Gammaproteobacteria bacterium]|nr:DUF4252 domain-containing protein [Gammaproteobacteria bacterium]